MIFRRIFSIISVLFIGVGQSLSAASISDVEAGNITPFSFEVVWKTSELAESGLSIFSDSGGLQSLAGEVQVEFLPLRSGDTTVSDDYAGRVKARALRTAISNRQLSLVRISGLEPDTSYWIQPAVVDENGGDVTEGGPLPLTEVITANANAFVSESRQLVIGFSNFDPMKSEAGIVRVALPNSDYPLFAVVGDFGTSTEAFINLDHLLTANGQTNLNPSAPLNLDIQLMGEGVQEGVMRLNVLYGGGTVTAVSTLVAFNPPLEDPTSFEFDAIGTQVEGQAFSVTIRALDENGDPLSTFAGQVQLSSSLNLSSGGGLTTNFSSGVLSDYEVTVSETGESTLTVTDPDTGATGTSAAFTVVDSTYTLTMNSLPEAGGNVSGAGVHNYNTNAVVVATANPGYTFDRWVGAGVSVYDAASTTVSMTEDRLVSAVFLEVTDLNLYGDWKPGAFLRAAGNSALTDPLYDFEGDGLLNIFEYAYGTSPLFAETESVLPRIEFDEVNPEDPVFYYRMRAGVTDLNVVIEYVTDLGDAWQTYTPDPAQVDVKSLEDNIQEIRVLMPDVPKNAAFFRLSVTLIEE